MAEKLIIGISGAPGAPITIALLKELRGPSIGIHLVIFKGEGLTVDQETGYGPEEAKQLVGTVYDNQDLDTSLASGSLRTLGVIVVPCSMKTLVGIHSEYSDNLPPRVAGVTIKERRRLVLVTKECPLSPIHLCNVCGLSQVGAVILPPVVGYYQRPKTIEKMTAHVVGKIVDQFSLGYQSFRR